MSGKKNVKSMNVVNLLEKAFSENIVSVTVDYLEMNVEWSLYKSYPIGERLDLEPPLDEEDYIHETSDDFDELSEIRRKSHRQSRRQVRR